MCDETFSVNYVADVPAGVDRGWFMFFVTLLDQFYWVAGATLGGLCGSLITFNTKGLDFVMTALFAVSALLGKKENAGIYNLSRQGAACDDFRYTALKVWILRAAATDCPSLYRLLC